MRTILPVVVIIVLVLASFALVIGVSLGIGWILTLVLPFSLFEGTIVGVIAAIATLTIWRSLFEVLSVDEFAEEADDEEAISKSRFWEHREKRTWENWLRYVLANAVYAELIDSLDWAEDTGERAVQELSIHLANVAVEGLKGKSPHTKRVRVSQGMLKHELVKQGGQAYPDEMLKAATKAVNQELMYWEDKVRKVVREQLWEASADAA
jgi:hypothetical protein